MAKHIRQCMTNLLNRQNSSAIPLQWKEEGKSNTLEVSTQEPKDIKLPTPYKNSVRTSCRLRRAPITRSKDFLWPMKTIQVAEGKTVSYTVK
jgi:hypothetical protein